MSELTIVKNIKKCANMKYKEIYAVCNHHHKTRLQMLVGTYNLKIKIKTFTLSNISDPKGIL